MFILGILLEWLGYPIARVLLPIVTFGRVRADEVMSMRSGFNWLGLKRESSGALLWSASMTASLGLLIWAFLLVGVIALTR